MSHECRLDHPHWISRGHLHDLFVLASSHKNLENKKNQGRFSHDVHHTNHRTVSLADLWVYSQRFAIDSGKCCKLYAFNVCPGSQDKAWVKIVWKYLDQEDNRLSSLSCIIQAGRAIRFHVSYNHLLIKKITLRNL